jgi:hypothetical protein
MYIRYLQLSYNNWRITFNEKWYNLLPSILYYYFLYLIKWCMIKYSRILPQTWHCLHQWLLHCYCNVRWKHNGKWSSNQRLDHKHTCTCAVTFSSCAGEIPWHTYMHTMVFTKITILTCIVSTTNLLYYWTLNCNITCIMVIWKGCGIRRPSHASWHYLTIFFLTDWDKLRKNLSIHVGSESWGK